MNTCDTWEFNSAKAKAMRLKAEANRWDARVCELLGDTVGVERHSALAGFMERSARVYDKWARQAPDAPKAEEPATGLKVGTCKVDCGCVSYCRDGLEPAPQPQAAPRNGAPDSMLSAEAVAAHRWEGSRAPAAPQPQASLNEPFGNSEGLPQAEPPFTVSELMHVALAAVHSFARPENWNDPEDPEQAEAWTLVDAALLAYKKAMEAAPQPQASAEDVARIDDFLKKRLRCSMYGINPAGVEWADEAWQRIRASLDKLRAELERLRRHLASAQADRAEEYRQREAWRAKAGRLEEVLKSIAEKRQPEAYTDWRPWHTWAEEVQDLAREWAPEEEG
jgi:hypothetical protein